MKFFAILLFTFIYTFFVNTSFGYQEYFSKNLGGKKVNALKVILDGKHKIIVSPSATGDNLKTLIKRVGGVSGINGSYFCPKDYPQCGGVNSNKNVQIYKGKFMTKDSYDDLSNTKFKGRSNIFGFDKNGDLGVYYSEDGYHEEKEYINSGKNPEEIYYGLSNYPVLLINGENITDKGIIDGKMVDRGTKVFICASQDEKTIYMGSISNIIVTEMADYLKKELGCYHALNLDSGGSHAMVYNNTYKAGPGRDIMDAFVVIPTENENKTEYDEVFKLFDKARLNDKKENDEIKKTELKDVGKEIIVPSYTIECDSKEFEKFSYDNAGKYYNFYYRISLKGVYEKITEMLEKAYSIVDDSKKFNNEILKIALYLEKQQKIYPKDIITPTILVQKGSGIEYEAEFCKQKVEYIKQIKKAPIDWDEWSKNLSNEIENSFEKNRKNNGLQQMGNFGDYEEEDYDYKEEKTIKKASSYKELLEISKNSTSYKETESDNFTNQLRKEKIFQLKYEKQLKKYFQKIDALSEKNPKKIQEIENKLLLLRKNYLKKEAILYIFDQIINYIHIK